MPLEDGAGAGLGVSNRPRTSGNRCARGGVNAKRIPGRVSVGVLLRRAGRVFAGKAVSGPASGIVALLNPDGFSLRLLSSSATSTGSFV